MENLTFYIDSFSPNVQGIFEELKYKEEIKTLDKNNRLLGVVKKFSDLDFDPTKVDNIKMGYMFEEIIRRFSENAEAGDHYTPREVIRLLTSIHLQFAPKGFFANERHCSFRKKSLTLPPNGVNSRAGPFVYLFCFPDETICKTYKGNNREKHDYSFKKPQICSQFGH